MNRYISIRLVVCVEIMYFYKFYQHAGKCYKIALNEVYVVRARIRLEAYALPNKIGSNVVMLT